MIVYRVILRVSYYDAYFEFDKPEEAINFAQNALEHMVNSEDAKKRTTITLQVVDVEAEKNEQEEE